MRRGVEVLVLALFLSAALAAESRALQSCSAMNGAGQSCSVSCDAGETAVCKAKPSYVSCDCNGGVAPPPGDLTIWGIGSGGTVRVEAYDISCTVLPCTPSLIGGVDVTVAPGMSPSDFAQDAVTAFGPVLGATCTPSVLSGAVEGIRLACGTFYPSYRICDAALGTCPEDLTPGTGTSGDSGVQISGLSFESPVPSLVAPALGPWGFVALAGVVLWAAKSRLRGSRREEAHA